MQSLNITPMKYSLHPLVGLFIMLFSGMVSGQANPPDWTAVENLQYNMQIVGKLQLQDETFSLNPDDMVAGFVDDQCRGVVSPSTEAGIEGFLFLSLGSNLPTGETIIFKAYIAELDLIVDINESVDFVSGTEIGTLQAPFIFTTESTDRIIMATADEGGSISPAGEVSVAYGEDQMFVISADIGHYITDVLIDSVSMGAITSYTFSDVTEDHSIHASFEINTYLLAYIVMENGSIQGEAYQTVPHGEDGTAVEVIPNEGYYFENWDDDSTDNPRTDYNITENHIFSTTLGVHSYQLTYFAGENGSLTGETTQTVDHGADGTPVEAIPNQGYHFVNWSDGSTDNPRIDLNVTGPIEATALFKVNSYTIIATADEYGSIAPQGEIIVEGGQDATFEIQPDVGYHIADVLIDDESIGPVSNYVFEAVSADHTIHAVFEINTYTLTYLSDETGTIQGEPIQNVEHGEDGTAVLAVGFPPFEFDSWSDGRTDNPRIDTNVVNDITATAHFSLTTHTITATAGDNGSITPDGEIIVEEGSSQAFTIEASEGYHIEDVLIDSTSAGAIGQYEFIDVTGNHSIHASFAINTYILAYQADSLGSIVGDTLQIVPHGANGTAVEALPNPGSFFMGWSDGSTANPRIDENITDDLSVEAIFSTTGPPGWVPDPNMQYNMQVVGQLRYADGSYSLNPNDVIAGFADNECRGIASPIPDLDGLVFLTLASNQLSGENITFKAYIADLNVVADLNESIEFVSMAEVGTMLEPFEFTYDEIVYSITASADSMGSISPSGEIIVPHGQNQGFSISPMEGYHIADVVTNNVSIGAVDTFTFVNVIQDHSIHASFAINIYNITATAGENGSIHPADTVMIPHGGDTLFTFLPDAGYTVYNVIVNGDSIGPMDSYLFSDVTQNHSIHVEFDLTTGHQETAKEGLNIRAYPNPVTNTLHLYVNEYILQSTSTYAVLYDYMGNKIKTFSLSQSLTSIDTRQFAPGIYFLKVWANNQYIETVKIVKAQSID